ncbi:FRG domain-containing protein [Segetibacter sp. 3557_3]|uniref:FRG domain-containing protein n=1 Tax=Segetibacter sp. 3557_3 TaxID=2547429 RepID=UPI0010584D68|nr:FRG domain-containing protein [Segetibacter sp. 3557_3]TDH23441.1 FRG domain-containing protein [Segetibacter sp. 3557_3]
MKSKIKISSFSEYLEVIERLDTVGKGITLYRGQSDSKPLIPTVARESRQKDTTAVEIDMLDELKRRSPLLITPNFKNDWDWLVFAQHFGLKTRLLDWSSNPLVALWFACSNEYKISNDSFVYIFEASDDFIVDINKNESPFTNERTKVLRPSLNNVRIVAQSGWFTAHKYSTSDKKFVELESNGGIKNLLTLIVIPAIIKEEIIKKLSVFGINNRTLFPDVMGLCSHLNWKFRYLLKA